MKNYLKLVTVSTLLFFSLISTAKEPKLVTDVASKSMVFELEAPSKGTSIRLIDSEGNIIYAEKVLVRETVCQKI